MIGILVVVLALSVSAATVLAARRSGHAWWPGALAALLIVAGAVVAIVGGIASESERGDQDWLAIGILIVLAGMAMMVVALWLIRR